MYRYINEDTALCFMPVVSGKQFHRPARWWTINAVCVSFFYPNLIRLHSVFHRALVCLLFQQV